MKRGSKKGQKLRKGMPSAVALRILIHAVLFLLAGMLVVFTVVKKEEQKFEPPKVVERPKMKLRKPKVKVRKTSKPKPTTRIVTKMNRANMPEIQLPEMSGMSTALEGGMGGFDMMPDFEDISSFGAAQSIGNDFQGTFYDFKRDRKGGRVSMEPEEFVARVKKFVSGGWKASDLRQFYASPKKLYATSFMIPETRSVFGPAAFGEVTGGWSWIAVYRGQLVYPEDIKFRFWGFADDILLVRVNGKLVLNGSIHKDGASTFITEVGGSWDSTAVDDARYFYGARGARVGDWVELKAGVPLEMEVMIGEVPGGEFSCMLTVQVDGVDYPKNRQGGPILPMFKTAEPTRAMQDIIYSQLNQNEAAVTNGPIFRDYMVAAAPHQSENTEIISNAENRNEPELKMRRWISATGKEIEAEYVSTSGTSVILKTVKGKQIKISKDKLSLADLEYIVLKNPPKFAINFIKLSNSQSGRYKLSPTEMTWASSQLPRVNDFTFGAKIKQRGAGEYSYPLTLEYFAIGQERNGNRYILLDRGESTFVPTTENERTHRLTGTPIEFVEYNVGGSERGQKPSGYLITLTDKTGRIIQHKASSAWLWEQIDNLKKLPVKAYMDKTCTRVYPTSPKPLKW